MMTRRDVLRSSYALAGIPLLSVFSPAIPLVGLAGSAPGSFPHQPVPEEGMLLVRDVFQCKPGRARALADTFQKAIPTMRDAGGLKNLRVLVDYIADYWTVVLESEVDDLAAFSRAMQAYSSRPEAREAMGNYMENVEGGHREIFRIHEPAA